MKRRVVFRPTASYRSFPIADPKLSNLEVLRKDCDLEDQDPAAVDIVSALSETVVPIVVVEGLTVEAGRMLSSYRRSVVDASVESNSIATVPAVVA